MNNSNIVAIPNHPPLPRGVPGVFQAVEQPYSSMQDTKPYSGTHRFSHIPGPQQQPTRLGMRGYGSPANRPRAHSSYHPQRRDSAASFISNPGTNGSGYDGSYGPTMHRRHVHESAPGAQHSRQASVASEHSASGSNADGTCNSDRKFVCDWANCGQSFDRIEHLNRHKRRHTGEKPYRCVVARCSKLFSRFDNMVQHVGIHTFEGVKTEIPKVTNLSAKGRGRGRARRTSYRGTQDPGEKFRRHVENILGVGLAKACILPADTPDYSNLTLRPLLVDFDAQTGAPLDRLPESQTVSPTAPHHQGRPRSDSVMSGADKHMPSASPVAVPNRVPVTLAAAPPPKSMPTHTAGHYQGSSPNIQPRPAAAAAAYPGPAQHPHVTVAYSHHRTSDPQQILLRPNVPDYVAHRHSMSNLREGPAGYSQEFNA
ncbi:hypothetical protein GGF46_000946 [Coemansia sp. RSA 552]|nr:hypothetical protein GGF46_000946 [Coemansia sp. RSA 552]